MSIQAALHNTNRNASPSHFRIAVKTTVFAGMFNPMENVSVAQRHYVGGRGKEQDDLGVAP